VDNEPLRYRLEKLMKEKKKYEDLIASAGSGDQLKTELYQLEEDIQDNRKDYEKARQDIVKLAEKLQYMQERYAVAKKKFDASKTLYDKGILSNSDYEKASADYFSIHDEYYDMESDSLVAAETVKSSGNIIDLLNARKKILSGNADMLSADYLIDLGKIESNINDMQSEVASLKVLAPADGIVTDINYRPGEKIDKGDVLAEIADLSRVWVIAYGTSSIYCGSGAKIRGIVSGVSPVMEKVTSLASTFEAAGTYTKIEIKFDDMQQALKHVTPGERLFVRIYF
jgi:multidrug efflux pump subunit AcrA (membrane-fusion protein)